MRKLRYGSGCWPAIVLLFGCLGWAIPAAAAMPKPGSVAPDFTLASGTGKNLKLSEYRGRVVMINFWATWCGPCRQEMPHLNRLYAQYQRAGFLLIGVNVDDNPNNARVMADQLGVRFPVLYDRDKQVSRRYDVDAMPATVILDRDGKVRHLHRGYRAGTEKAYETQLRELLKQ